MFGDAGETQVFLWVFKRVRESDARCIIKGPGVDERALLNWLLSQARTFCEGTLCIVVAVMGANSITVGSSISYN